MDSKTLHRKYSISESVGMYVHLLPTVGLGVPPPFPTPKTKTLPSSSSLLPSSKSVGSPRDVSPACSRRNPRLPQALRKSSGQRRVRNGARRCRSLRCKGLPHRPVPPGDIASARPHTGGTPITSLNHAQFGLDVIVPPFD